MQVTFSIHRPEVKVETLSSSDSVCLEITLGRSLNAYDDVPRVRVYLDEDEADAVAERLVRAVAKVRRVRDARELSVEAYQQEVRDGR